MPPPRIALLVLLALCVIACCRWCSASPKLNNAVLWKRLGLNRAIGGERPQITATKKKGESTVYFIKLPPQPHYYIPLNALPSAGHHGQYDGRHKSTPDPFQTVDVDFTANGKPEHVYHWNLPLNLTVPVTAPTSTTPTYAPEPPTTTSAPDLEFNKKPIWQQRFLNNGKPQKLYFVKPFYKTDDSSSSYDNPAGFKKHYNKKSYYQDSDTVNHVHRIQSANDY